MKRIPNNILPQFEKETGIKAKVISAYLSDKDPAMPGRKRCIYLSRASKKLGYDFSPSDWMFNPEAIKKTIIKQELIKQALKNQAIINEALKDAS